MKSLILLVTLLPMAIFAHEKHENLHEEGKELHNESCVACHIAEHNHDFYTRDERKVQSLGRLKGQVSGCTQAFNVDWFPEEEASVVDYLNAQFYQFK